MSEKKTETTKGMRFHRFYTYVYLPLSAMLALFIALGRFYYITTISLSTYRGWVELVHATYPLVCCVLSVAALPFLIGKTSVGRRIVQITTGACTHRSLPCLWQPYSSSCIYAPSICNGSRLWLLQNA